MWCSEVPLKHTGIESFRYRGGIPARPFDTPGTVSQGKHQTWVSHPLEINTSAYLQPHPEFESGQRWGKIINGFQYEITFVIILSKNARYAGIYHAQLLRLQRSLGSQNLLGSRINFQCFVQLSTCGKHKRTFLCVQSDKIGARKPKLTWYDGRSVS